MYVQVDTDRVMLHHILCT